MSAHEDVEVELQEPLEIRSKAASLFFVMNFRHGGPMLAGFMRPMAYAPALPMRENRGVLMWC